MSKKGHFRKLVKLIKKSSSVSKIFEKWISSPRKKQLAFGIIKATLKGGLKGGINFIQELDQRKKGLSAMDTSKPVFIKDLFLDRHTNNQLLSCIDIVVPVYNGYDFLEPLFSSLYQSTTTAHRIIVINDCSPDSRVAEFLQSTEQYKNQYCQELLIIHNSENLGFVQTVNSALVYLQNNFVILNTDVEVPHGWLERLMTPFETNSNIASTTPFTNSGTICSFPVWLEDNQLPFGLDCNAIDNIFHYVNLANTQQKMPTGVGFCMGMNKSLVDKIGLFDAETFGKGYCEENDWCQRAIKQGYKNTHVTNLFVYHKHGGSFGNSKQQLIKQNYAKLIKKHKNYDADVAKYIQKNSLADLRSCLLLKLAIQQNNTILIFDHGLGGGASKYLEENILINSSIALLVSGFYNSSEILVRIFTFDCELLKVRFTNLEYFYANFVKNKKFSYIYLNHLLTISNLSLIKTILENNALDSSYYLHDFLAICPSYTLLNQNGKYCGTTTELNKCNDCQSCNSFQLRNNIQFTNINSWRNTFGQILLTVNHIYCFSNDSYNHITKIYPDIVVKCIIQPHTIRTSLTKIKNNVDFSKNKIITVAALGAIDYPKGRAILQKLANNQLFKSKQFKLILVGYSDVPNIKNCQITGKYNIKQLSKITQELNVDLFIIPSIWPETFCYTVEEIMMLGLPLICFNIGAPAERIINYEHGYLCNKLHPDSLSETIASVASLYNFTT